MRADIIPRHTSTGRALWATHAIWATLLEDWERAHNTSGTPDSWTGIEFDKLAHLAHLLWNALHAKEMTSFASVYDSAHGLHGPGPALPRRGARRRHIPVLDALDHIQGVLGENPDIHLFDLRTRQYEGKTQYTVRAGRERTYLPIHLSSNLRAGWSDPDKEVVRGLSALVRRFDKAEVRALGTHQNKTKTIEAIEYNVFVHLFNRLTEETETIENRGIPRRNPVRKFGKSDLPSLAFVVNEIDRKALENRGPFRTGYNKIIEVADTGNVAAQIARDVVFDPPDNIWDAEVTAWKGRGELMQRLYDYIRALRNALVPASLGSDDAELEVHSKGTVGRDEIYERLRVELPAIPSNGGTVYPWRQLRTAIVVIFDALPRSTVFGIEVYRRAAQRFR